jgi:hypothetical protein
MEPSILRSMTASRDDGRARQPSHAAAHSSRKPENNDISNAAITSYLGFWGLRDFWVTYIRVRPPGLSMRAGGGPSRQPPAAQPLRTNARQAARSRAAKKNCRFELRATPTCRKRASAPVPFAWAPAWPADIWRGQVAFDHVHGQWLPIDGALRAESSVVGRRTRAPCRAGACHSATCQRSQIERLEQAGCDRVYAESEQILQVG